jgi:hypothetical protein
MAYVACSKVFTRFGTDKREALRGASTRIIAEPSKDDGRVSSDTVSLPHAGTARAWLRQNVFWSTSRLNFWRRRHIVVADGQLAPFATKCKPLLGLENVHRDATNGARFCVGNRILRRHSRQSAGMACPRQAR